MKVLGQRSFKQLIFDDFEETVLAASILINPENDRVEAPHHARFKISQAMDQVVRRVADVRKAGPLRLLLADTVRPFSRYTSLFV